MTTYGTIPTQVQASSSLSFLGRAKEQILLDFSSRRTWLELINFYSFSFPVSFSEATERIKTNILFFRVNYTVIIFFTIIVSLIWQPVHLIIFLILVISWLLFYYTRNDEPLVIFGRVIDDSAVMMVLLVFTMAMFLLTNVTGGVLIGFSIGFSVILVHSVCRNRGDLFLMEDDEEYPRARNGETKPLKNTASSSFSSSS